MGRWALTDGQEPSVKNITVNGAHWKIPRIHPDHFTVAQFERAIDEATMVSPQAWKDRGIHAGVHAEPELRYPNSVSFLWLDVACIDQRFNTDSMSEIGRQSKIFAGALCVYVWLNRQPYDNLENMFVTMIEISSYAFAQLPTPFDEAEGTVTDIDLTGNPWSDYFDESDEIWLQKAVSCLEELCEDPWFTSLWTLQEAFLCTYSVFLSSDAGCVLIDHWNDGKFEFGGLKFLLTSCDLLKTYCERMKFSDIDGAGPRYHIRHKLLNIVSIRGLGALNCANPMALYAAARYRTATEELDYVYGIMQIFGLRLGKSNPDLNEHLNFSLVDLEDQLGEALMRMSPVWSQSHVHTISPREFGKGWRVSRSSVLPGLGYDREVPWQFYKDEFLSTDCQMTTQLVHSVRLGCFSGKACPFATLQKAWASIYEAQGRKKQDNASWWMESGSPMHIALDFAPDIFPHLQNLSDYQINGALGQYELAARMAESFGEYQLQVLHLAAFDHQLDLRSHFGLILLHRSVNDIKYWHRLGICTWMVNRVDESLLTPTCDQLSSQSWRARHVAGLHIVHPDDVEWIEPPDFKATEHLTCVTEEWKPLRGLFG